MKLGSVFVVIFLALTTPGDTAPVYPAEVANGRFLKAFGDNDGAGPAAFLHGFREDKTEVPDLLSGFHDVGAANQLTEFRREDMGLPGHLDQDHGVEAANQLTKFRREDAGPADLLHGFHAARLEPVGHHLSGFRNERMPPLAGHLDGFHRAEPVIRSDPLGVRPSAGDGSILQRTDPVDRSALLNRASSSNIRTTEARNAPKSS